MNTIILQNGQAVKVSSETYNKILLEVDDSKYYDSATKGKLLISEMTEEHLKNAITKRIRESAMQVLDETRKLDTDEFLEIMTGTLEIGVGDEQVEEMFKELGRRNTT